jgi:hypothetical protein
MVKHEPELHMDVHQRGYFGYSGLEPATSSSRTPRSSRLYRCLHWPGLIWMKPNALDSGVVAVLCCCTDRLLRRPGWSVRRVHHVDLALVSSLRVQGPAAQRGGLAVRTAPSINSLSTWPSLLFTRVLAVPTERNRQPEPAYCYEWLKPYRSPSALSAPSTLVPRPCHATIRA